MYGHPESVYNVPYIPSEGTYHQFITIVYQWICCLPDPHPARTSSPQRFVCDNKRELLNALLNHVWVLHGQRASSRWSLQSQSHNMCLCHWPVNLRSNVASPFNVDLREEQNGAELIWNQKHVLRYLFREYLVDDLPPIVDGWENNVFGSVLHGDGQGIPVSPATMIIITRSGKRRTNST